MALQNFVFGFKQAGIGPVTMEVRKRSFKAIYI